MIEFLLTLKKNLSDKELDPEKHKEQALLVEIHDLMSEPCYALRNMPRNKSGDPAIPNMSVWFAREDKEVGSGPTRGIVEDVWEWSDFEDDYWDDGDGDDPVFCTVLKPILYNESNEPVSWEHMPFSWSFSESYSTKGEAEEAMKQEKEGTFASNS